MRSAQLKERDRGLVDVGGARSGRLVFGRIAIIRQPSEVRRVRKVVFARLQLELRRSSSLASSTARTQPRPRTKMANRPGIDVLRLLHSHGCLGPVGMEEEAAGLVYRIEFFARENSQQLDRKRQGRLGDRAENGGFDGT